MRISDWSSDVCASDLGAKVGEPGLQRAAAKGVLLAGLGFEVDIGLGHHVPHRRHGRIIELPRRVHDLQPVVVRALEKLLRDRARLVGRSEEHTSELQSLMRISYAVFCLKKKTHIKHTTMRQATKEQPIES